MIDPPGWIPLLKYYIALILKIIKYFVGFFNRNPPPGNRVTGTVFHLDNAGSFYY